VACLKLGLIVRSECMQRKVSFVHVRILMFGSSLDANEAKPRWLAWAVVTPAPPKELKKTPAPVEWGWRKILS
jgi:hypothetical protein